MAPNLSNKSKEQQLRKQRGLNPNPETVIDELFRTNEFFDPRDHLQVRYEMIRRHRVDKITIKEAARQFGVSRVTFHKFASMFDKEGIIGLISHKPGPQNPHKCTHEIIEFVTNKRKNEPKITMKTIISEVNEEFGVTLHRRTIERALAKYQKKGQRAGEQQSTEV
jgi:transposase